MRVAVLFPGQGSQEPGMADPWATHRAGREVLDACSAVLEWDVMDACRDEARLADTTVVQPALFACDLAAWAVLEAEGLRASAAAGHSLGEFAALVAAGASDLEPTLGVVVERGAAMRDAAEAAPGAMTALVGVAPAVADELCRMAGRGDVLAVANENSPKQTVLSGSLAAVERLEELARSRKVRTVRLSVAGAFHSPLMRPALGRVRAAVARLEIREPRLPVVPNASGRPTTRPEAIRDLLSRHLVSPVRWERSMRAIADLGVDTFVEPGPGDVLSRLAKRCVPGARVVPVGTPKDARSLAGEAVGAA